MGRTLDNFMTNFDACFLAETHRRLLNIFMVCFHNKIFYFTNDRLGKIEVVRFMILTLEQIFCFTNE